MAVKERVIEFIKNLPEDEKKDFDLLGDEKKLQFITRIGERLAQSEAPAPVDAPSAALNISQGLQREEAAFAEPMLDIVQSDNPISRAINAIPGLQAGPVLGQERIDRSLQESAASGLRGETISPFQPDRQAELGDVFRSVGLPEPVAATGGLLASGMLPSGMLGGFIGRGLLKGAQATTKAAGKASLEKALTTVPLEGLDDTFRNTFRRTEAVADRGELLASEAIESMTNVGSDAILYAFKNPEVLTRDMARPEKLADVAKEGAEHLMKATAKNPQAFSFDERVFSNLADDVANEFDNLIQGAGKRVEAIKNLALDLAQKQGDLDELSIPFSGISDYIDELLSAEGAFDDAGKLIPAAKEKKTVQALLRMKGNLGKLTAKEEVPIQILGANGQPIKTTRAVEKITPKQAFLLKDVIDEIAFDKDFLRLAEGIEQPLPKVNRVARLVRGQVNRLIRDKFQGIPGFTEAYDEFSKLAEIRSSMKGIGRDKQTLAKFMRKIPDLQKSSPEALEDFSQFMQAIPNGEKYAGLIESFHEVRANAPDQVLPFLASRNKGKVEAGLLNLLKKDVKNMTAKESEILDKILPDALYKKAVAHKVAQSFSKKANIFRALAAGGSLGLFGSEPAGAFAKFLGGFAATDPRFAGMMIRLKAAPKVAKKIKELAKTAANLSTLPARGSARKLLAGEGERPQ